jgi:hypothetical protein
MLILGILRCGLSEAFSTPCCTHPFHQLLQDLDFDEGLGVEAFLVADDLDGHVSTRLVIPATENLAETAFAEHTRDFVPVTQMVSLDDQVVTSLVVIAVVVLPTSL